jgi:hypothetical protein
MINIKKGTKQENKNLLFQLIKIREEQEEQNQNILKCLVYIDTGITIAIFLLIGILGLSFIGLFI